MNWSRRRQEEQAAIVLVSSAAIPYIMLLQKEGRKERGRQMNETLMSWWSILFPSQFSQLLQASEAREKENIPLLQNATFIFLFSRSSSLKVEQKKEEEKLKLLLRSWWSHVINSLLTQEEKRKKKVLREMKKLFLQRWLTYWLLRHITVRLAAR